MGSQPKAAAPPPESVEVEVSGEELRAGLELETDKNVLVRVAPIVEVELDVDPKDPRAKDDRITLVADDGSLRVTKTVADDAVPGDQKTTIRFSVKDASKTYSVHVDPGREGKPYWLVRSARPES